MNTEKTAPPMVLHGLASGPVLIVSGLGALEEYLYATAIALRSRPGAEVAFASRQALPDVLAARAGDGFREVLLLGMGLSANLDRFASALAALHKGGAKVIWLSGGFALPHWMPESTKKLFAISSPLSHEGSR